MSVWVARSLRVVFATVIVLVFGYYFFSRKLYAPFFTIPISYHFISLLIALGVYFISGLQYFNLRLGKSPFDVNKLEVLFFSIGMNFWGYVLPFQGSIIFSSLYLKKVYGLNISKSVSISILLVLISILMSLFICAFVLWYYNHESQKALFLILSGILIVLIINSIAQLSKLISKHVSKGNSSIRTYTLILTKIFEELPLMIRSFFGSRRTVFIYLIRLALLSTWYYLIALSIGKSQPFVFFLILFFISESSLIIKLTPGNLGISQFLSGSVFVFIGASPELAVFISTYIFSITLLICLLLGFPINRFLFKKMGMSASNFLKLENV